MGQPPPPWSPPPSSPTPSSGGTPPPTPPGHGTPPAGVGPQGRQTPPPGWGQPPAAPPPRKGGGGKVLAIVLPLVGLFLLLLLCCCGGFVAYQTGMIGREDPVESVESFFDAAVAGDCDEMVDRVTEETWRQGGASNRAEAVVNCEVGLENLPVTRPTSYQLVSESDDTAVVRVVFPPVELPELGSEFGPGTDTEVDYHLRRDGRRWLIDGPASGLQLGGTGTPPGALPQSPGLETPAPTLPETPDVPTATALWGDRTDVPFRIELEERTLTGELHQLDRYDHPGCASAAVDPSVAADLADCLGRIEAVYLGEHDGIRISQQVFTFTDEDAAVAFASHFDGVWAPELVSFTDPGDIYNLYSESRSEAVGPYVVLTLMVSSSSDDDSVRLAQDHAHALHAETVNVFIWGGP